MLPSASVEKKESCRSFIGIRFIVCNVLVAMTAFNVGFTARTNLPSERLCPPCDCHHHYLHHQLHRPFSSKDDEYNGNNNSNNSNMTTNTTVQRSSTSLAEPTTTTKIQSSLSSSSSIPTDLQRKTNEKCITPATTTETATAATTGHHQVEEGRFRFPPSLNKYLVGMGRVNRDEFAKMFDVGVPLMESSHGNDEVLILYGDEDSLPANHHHHDRNSVVENINNNNNASSSSSTDHTNIIPLSLSNSSPTRDATKNCLTMKLIFLEPEESYQCLAIMGQWQAHVVHRFRRLVIPTRGPRRDDKASLDQPFQYASRTFQRFLEYPVDIGMEHVYASFTNYATHRRDILQRLQPIAHAVVHGNNNNNNNTSHYNNTIVITLCNHGQSELLMNFVCMAQSRGLMMDNNNTSQALVFATDPETRDLAHALGVAAFYDEQLFGELPKTAAKQFGDGVFKNMIMTKVYCLHLIHQLGYDVLYQDIDVLWFQHPLDYFVSSLSSQNNNNNNDNNNNIGDFDIYFQDDGARDSMDEQYHANGGFFFIRNNARTAYFVSSLVRAGEYIWKENEQYAINALLNDHASFTGLRAKTLSRDDGLFPGGWNFHRRPEQMKEILSEQGKNITAVPYIFHMSWTNHKEEKRQFLEQMGLFHVRDQCIGKTVSELTDHRLHSTTITTSTSIKSACCVANPIPICHYRDKPSKIPCRDSPPMEQDMPSFW